MPNIQQAYSISANHPCFAGHFPGNPIVPGVVILNYAQQLLQQWQPTLRIKRIAQAKFLQPLYPEQTFTLNLCHSGAETIKFECRHDLQCVATGTFLIETLNEQ